MGDGGIWAKSGIEDAVIVEIPLIPHVSLRWLERRGQGDVDEVSPTGALLILHASGESNVWRALRDWC